MWLPQLAYASGVQLRWEPEPDNIPPQDDAECKPSARGTGLAAYMHDHMFKYIHKIIFSQISTALGGQRTVLTRDLLWLQTFHGREIVDGGPSQ